MNNLKTLFHVTIIPKDTWMREVIDEVDPEEIMPLFDGFFRPLQRGKHLEQYSVSGRYIAAIDGSQYFTSEKISCPGCLIKEGLPPEPSRLLHASDFRADLSSLSTVTQEVRE